MNTPRCTAICITVGAAPAAAGPAFGDCSEVDWSAVDALKQGLTVPVMVKGITTPEAAQVARCGTWTDRRVELAGWRERPRIPWCQPAAIVDTVGGKVPVLVDGSFRRGTDILKALAFGARVCCGTTGHVGPGGLRGRRSAGDRRDAADRTRPVYGDVQPVAFEDARSLAAETAPGAGRQDAGHSVRCG